MTSWLILTHLVKSIPKFSLQLKRKNCNINNAGLMQGENGISGMSFLIRKKYSNSCLYLSLEIVLGLKL